MDFKKIIRKHLLTLEPYSTARDEGSGVDAIFLDANESPFNKPFNRYPDPRQCEFRQHIAKMKGLAVEQVFAGNGSDEAIDLLIKAFCEPGEDAAVVLPPTYGMYAVAARTHGIQVNEILLNENFQPDVDKILTLSKNNKLLFLCSPNNPTGNITQKEIVIELLHGFKGIVVLDEAYIDFATEKSLLDLLQTFPNLVILQTFSKAWALAGVRCGLAFAHPEVIAVMDRVKLPYNLNQLTIAAVLKRMQKRIILQNQIQMIIHERKKLFDALKQFSFVEHVFPSEANFILVRVHNADKVYQYLIENGIIVRNRSKQQMLNNCLRITVGSINQNKKLLKTLKHYTQ
jgi:histidinol-phosphate aminotransferase